MSDLSSLIGRFEESFGGAPTFGVRAPGRVNLIGEHTDYNDGFVFPAAIDYDVRIVGRPREDGEVRLWSALFDRRARFSLGGRGRSRRDGWANYVRGVAVILAGEDYPLRGMDAVVDGSVPLSSGLSSSAALEVASCLAFEAAGGFALEPKARALLCQRAEREFVGVQCGIMDQFISALGRADHALFIDTRTLDFTPAPLPTDGVRIVIGNTNKPRGLVDSAYNERRSQCEEGVRLLQAGLPAIRALRDVSPDDLAAGARALPEVVLRRCRHVISENARTVEGVAALQAGDLVRFGRLMNESHDSLRDDYEVSCDELNAMVDAARRVEGVHGARMTGAGFGGCTVSLVQDEALPAFLSDVGDRYSRATGRTATFYVCRASNGAERVF
jgi:galactokinase